MTVSFNGASLPDTPEMRDIVRRLEYTVQTPVRVDQLDREGRIIRSQTMIDPQDISTRAVRIAELIRDNTTAPKESTLAFALAFADPSIVRALALNRLTGAAPATRGLAEEWARVATGKLPLAAASPEMQQVLMAAGTAKLEWRLRTVADYQAQNPGVPLTQAFNMAALAMDVAGMDNDCLKMSGLNAPALLGEYRKVRAAIDRLLGSQAP